MMTANVIETAQNVIIATHRDNGLSGDFAGEVLTWIAYAIALSDHLPRAGKYTL
jgi:hypothetical protein